MWHEEREKIVYIYKYDDCSFWIVENKFLPLFVFVFDPSETRFTLLPLRSSPR